jgi:hypothetical protein
LADRLDNNDAEIVVQGSRQADIGSQGTEAEFQGMVGPSAALVRVRRLRQFPQAARIHERRDAAISPSQGLVVSVNRQDIQFLASAAENISRKDSSLTLA